MTAQQHDLVHPQTIANLHWKIERAGIRQENLLSPSRLATLAQRSNLRPTMFSGIRELWTSGCLRADLVVVGKEPPAGFVILGKDRDDRRICGDVRSNVLNLHPEQRFFLRAQFAPDEMEPMFHPFRIFVLLELARRSVFGVDGLRSNAQATEPTGQKTKWFREWLATDNSASLVGYVNQIAGLAAISDPCALPEIRKTIQSGSFLDFQTVQNGIDEYRPDLHNLYQEIGLEAIESARRDICFAAESRSHDKTINKVVRLMATHTRKQLKGPVAAAYRVQEVAETLRRVSEAAFGQELPEEDELGLGTVIVSTKTTIQGNRRLLDADRKVKGAFLRSVGLDYGVRANLYVEGATEVGAMNTLFAGSGTVVVKDLAGQIVEKKRKGLAFRESLEHDLQTHTFSFVLLDGDVGNNVQVIKTAAKNDAICGAFLISEPDLEFRNFTIDDLSTIISGLLADAPAAPELDEILDAIRDAKNAREMFQRFNEQFPAFPEVCKGHRWGEALIEFAWDNPKWSPGTVTEPTIRPIMEFVRWILQAPSVSYVLSKERNRVNADTGQPESRN